MSPADKRVPADAGRYSVPRRAYENLPAKQKWRPEAPFNMLFLLYFLLSRQRLNLSLNP
jgi:hypothetical protein